jgi:formate dehydrogenase subunit delta
VSHDAHTAGIAPEARLGNDIARQFAHLPEDEAVERIAFHIDRFWDPRMRRRLLELMSSDHGGPDPALDPLLVAAAHRI